MKTIIPLVFIIYCHLALAGSSYSQQNLFNPINDTSKSFGFYYDHRDKSVKSVHYLKHFLTVQLKTNLLTDSIYLFNFYDFLKTQNAILRNPLNRRLDYGYISIRLSDTSNAINYVRIFYDSNLFEFIYPAAYGELSNKSDL